MRCRASPGPSVRRPTAAALDDARETTAELLVPVVPGRWLRLAALVPFVGGGLPAVGLDPLASTLGGPVPPGAWLGGFDPGSAPLPADPPALPAVDPATLAAGVAASLVVLGVGYAVVGAVAEFVVVVGLRDRQVALLGPARAALGPGIRLAAFRLGLWAAALAVVGVPAAAVLAGAVVFSPAVALLAVALVPLGLATLAAVWLGQILTTDLAVPTILATDARGPVAAWRRLWPVLASEPTEVGLYLLVRIVLGVTGTAATGLVGGLAAVAVAVPFALAGLGLVALAPGPGLGPGLGPGPEPGPGMGLGLGGAALVAAAGLAVAYLGTAVGLVLLIRTPVVAFVRSFGLATLGRLDPALDTLGIAGTTDAGGAGTTD